MNNIAKMIKGFCEEKDLGYRDNYSGRCMFGRTCVGIVTENVNNTIAKLAEYMVSQGIDYEKALGEICSDAMGMGFIVYFPSVSA